MQAYFIVTKLFSLIRGLRAWDDTLVGDWCPRFRYATLLRVCRNYAFNLSMTDETGFYAPSMAHNALPSRPWLGISVFHGIISTVSKPLRYSLTGSMCDALQTATCGTYSLLKLRYFIVASVSDSQHTGYGLSASLWDTWGFPWSAHPDLSPHHCDAQWTHPAFVQIPYAEPSV